MPSASKTTRVCDVCRTASVCLNAILLLIGQRQVGPEHDNFTTLRIHLLGSLLVVVVVVYCKKADAISMLLTEKHKQIIIIIISIMIMIIIMIVISLIGLLNTDRAR